MKAIRRAHRRADGGAYAQVALSGRAAKRLRDATGGDAMTVYRYLKDVELGRLKTPRAYSVVDEFSMIGTPDLWLLLTLTRSRSMSCWWATQHSCRQSRRVIRLRC